MRKNYITGILIFMCLSMTFGTVNAQGILNKIKNKMEDKVVDEVFKEKKADESNPGAPSGSESPSDRSGTRNTRGGGLVVTPPNVNENIDAASSAFKTRKYSDSRYAIRQAILGIEMEIGKGVLESLPESVNGLNKNGQSDRVTSSGIGFVGMTIERVYAKGDQELKLMIANNSAMLSAVSMYMSTGMYGTSTDQNYKQTQFQGHRGVIEFDEYSGYKLSVPFGQSSLFILEGVNFENEQQIMAAAEKFDITKIKKQLGEQ
jgi:hypothetical protein